jgi:hypothetical protein
MFTTGMGVEYRGFVGVIDFVCWRYIRIKLPCAEGRDNPLLLVYSESQEHVVVLKDNS